MNDISPVLHRSIQDDCDLVGGRPDDAILHDGFDDLDADGEPRVVLVETLHACIEIDP